MSGVLKRSRNDLQAEEKREEIEGEKSHLHLPSAAVLDLLEPLFLKTPPRQGFAQDAAELRSDALTTLYVSFPPPLCMSALAPDFFLHALLPVYHRCQVRDDTVSCDRVLHLSGFFLHLKASSYAGTSQLQSEHEEL